MRKSCAWSRFALDLFLPLLLAIAAIAATGVVVPLCWLLAAIVAMVGVLIERWLFFAEAKHTVTLYYGRERRSVT